MTSLRKQRAVRVFGVLTAAYGVSAILRPQTLARWTGLGDPAAPGAAVRTLSTTIGARDVCSGAAIVLARQGRPLRAALVARAAFDAGDAVIFGTLCPTRRARITVAAVAAGWGALAGAAALRTPPCDKSQSPRRKADDLSSTRDRSAPTSERR